MGKRVGAAPATEHQQQPVAHDVTRNVRNRRKRSGLTVSAVKSKFPRVNNAGDWHENDDEDSSSNDADVDTEVMHTPQMRSYPNAASKQINNSSILLNASINASLSELNNSGVTDSPKPIYTLRPSVVNGTILHDLKSKPWRLGRPIGKGNFGEIFLASDDVIAPVTNDNAKYVVKIEPHTNGPLFVEIHCLMNTANNNKSNNSTPNEDDENIPHKEDLGYNQLSECAPSGIPDYIATGSHFFDNVRYRFLVLPRFDRDLHSIIKNSCVQQKSLLTLAINIVNVLENLHDRGYCHNDIKAQNLMISKCKYLKKQVFQPNDEKANRTHKSKKYNDEHYEEKQQTTDSGNSSEQEANDDDFFPQDAKFIIKKNAYDDEEDEDFDDGATTNSNNSNSVDMFQTPVNPKRQPRRRNNVIEFSGSNPVRSCRREKRHSMYEEMVKSHYLRPSKRISYSELFNEDGVPVTEDTQSGQSASSDDEYEEFLPRSIRRTTTASNKKIQKQRLSENKRSTRSRQDQLTNGNSSGKTPRGLRSSVNAHTHTELEVVEEERIFLIDFGLASKYQDRGVHRPFIMDQRRAHDGTLEFTSRDAHLGAHSRRSDLECLGYNLLYWSQGNLPWKEAAMQHQQEKVHRSKELLMTDVREMLKQIYGKQVPKYLGEFLHHVGQLGYQQRPDYERYRNIFKREYQQLGYDYNKIQLNSNEILRTCVRVKDEPDGVKCDIFELNNGGVIRNAVVNTPFQEHSFTTRVSPKNLRSKSEKKNLKKKKFSWAELLSQDPDQIARERAVKEFEREEVICPLKSRKSKQYEGKPTYAILQIQQRLRLKGRAHQENNTCVVDYDHQDNPDVENEDSEDENNDDNEIEESDQDTLEEESETDGSESSEKLSRKRIVRRASNKKENIQTEVNVQRMRRKCVSTVKFNTKTRSSASLKTIEKPLKVSAGVSANKRGNANTRKDYTTAASAAGEIELRKRQLHQHDHQQNDNCNKTYERRTRRCLIKTESVGNGDLHLGDESNSNFDPDMNGIYNVWKKFDNEHIYAKGRSATNTASKHSRK